MIDGDGREFGKGEIFMQQCPFCGTQWKGRGPCPHCGKKPEVRDDSLFQPPADGQKDTPDSSQRFEVEELLRWKPSAETSSEEEGKEHIPSTEPEPDAPPKKKPMKWWHKLAMAAVAVIVAAALVIQLWPQTPVLPKSPVFFVQDEDLMMLPANGEPEKITEYALDLENGLCMSPDQKSIAWDGAGVTGVYLLPAAGEEVRSWKDHFEFSPEFSRDGKYLYFLAEQEDGDSRSIRQYNLETEEEQQIGLENSNSFVENGELIAMKNDTQLAVYDLDTREEKWSQTCSVSWMEFFEDQLYFVTVDEKKSQFCCWQDGNVEVLLDNVECLYFPEEDTFYIQCYQEETFSVTELVKPGDYGEVGEVLLQKLETMKVHSPARSLYYFDGSTLHSMGENERLYFFPQREKGAMVCSVESPSYEEAKGTCDLTEICQTWTVDMLTLSLNELTLQVQMESIWPCEISQAYIASGEKLYPLPEDAPRAPYQMRMAGDWVCFYETEENNLWLGKIEGEQVVSKNSFRLQSPENFMVTAEGNVYAWSGDSTGTLFENGVPIASQVEISSIQYTDDGAIYFLSGSSTFELTLSRLYQGKQEQLAENVRSFTAYTRDYAAYLQYREDGQGEDLFTSTKGEKPTLAAQQVENLLPSIEEGVSSFSFLSVSDNLSAGMDAWNDEGCFYMS